MTNEYMLPKPVSTDEDYRIACYFYDKLTEQFSHWKIKFHLPTFELKQYTHVQSCGWNIYYQFGYDEEPYMEVYSTHRMASDSRKCYYLDGKTKILPSFNTVCIVGEEDIFHAYNDGVAKVVFDKESGILRGL